VAIRAFQSFFDIAWSDCGERLAGAVQEKIYQKPVVAWILNSCDIHSRDIHSADKKIGKHYSGQAELNLIVIITPMDRGLTL
jgi:hypothetical protein